MTIGAKKGKQPSAASGIASGFDIVGKTDEEGNAPAASELVTEMVDGKTDADKEQAPLIIPGAGNTFALGGAQHLRHVLQADSAVTDAEASARIAISSATAADAAPVNPDVAVVPVDENEAAAEAVLADIRAGDSTIFGADDTERYRRDVATRADSTPIEGYESVSIEDFGKAYLRGYGWQEANDGGPVPVEYVPRPTLLGLGATPKPEEAKNGGAPSRVASSNPRKCVIAAPTRHSRSFCSISHLQQAA